MSVLHRHRWKLVSVQHVKDVSFGSPGDPYTRFLRVCEVCGKASSKRVRGTWTLDDLLGGSTNA